MTIPALKITKLYLIQALLQLTSFSMSGCMVIYFSHNYHEVKLHN